MTMASVHSLDQRKRALIICNHEYQSGDRFLRHLKDKAEQLYARLVGMKFTVMMQINIQNSIMSVVQNFQRDSQEGDLVFVYYFGLGYNDGETNYLLPVQVDPNEIDLIKDNANKVQRIIQRLVDEKEPVAVIFILDCCRSYELWSESIENTVMIQNGLLKMERCARAYIQFACSTGEIADDDYFFHHLLRNIDRENITASDVFRDTRQVVYRQRCWQKNPFYVDGLSGSHCLYLNFKQQDMAGPDLIEKRALIINNMSYSLLENRLTNSNKTIRQLRRTLQKINFQIAYYEDLLDESQMMNSVITFTRTINDGDLVMCYLSGHACHVNNENYFIPVNDKRIHDDRDVEVFGIHLSQLFDRLTENKPNSTFILILDCCRPYIVVSKNRKYDTVQNKGLSIIKLRRAVKMFLQYSCPLMKTSKDELFSQCLMKRIGKKNIPVHELFEGIIQYVYRKRHRRLCPCSVNRLPEDEQVFLNIATNNLPDIPFDAQWTFTGYTLVSSNKSNSSLYELRSPQGISIHKDQSLLIADSRNHRITSYNLDSGRIRKIAGKGINGYGSVLLSNPSNVIFHQQTDSYIISDFSNRRILKCSSNGHSHMICLFDRIASIGLATDIEGNLYISDFERHEVKRYQIGAKHGILVAGGHGQGHRLQQLSHPTYICVDNDYSVYVSDSGNNRVVQWKRGAQKGVIVAGGNGKGKRRSQLDSPLGIVVDQLGTIYVADCWNHRIMRWRKDEQPDIIVGNQFLSGDNSEQMNCPASLAFDDSGNLYVSDSNNNRIQRFTVVEP